ncbi:alanine--tRNA ligase [Podospora australis]|uniref:Alanine--tRNA ligase n=1 Tax=Podospora australis TaxID=1536484 RepID=A0AAN7AJP6_9PEZI|nr:alanine--tRNA ligase [Podospora australis]
MKKSLWSSCSGRRPCGGSYRPAFVTLSHCARTFHHKNRPTPPSSSRLENFLAVAATLQPAALLHAALLDLHTQHPLNFRSGYRFYSSSRTLLAMAETKWTGAEVRKTFLNFFSERGHTIVPSSSVVPHNDPTLLFTNAGMNQFKPIFLGTIGKTEPMAALKRATDTQKCIRAGGKHNDLDDVGKDSYHHTFFEMLGNWSFGDYFKKEAVQYSWELLTKVYGLDPDRLYCSYFEGNPELGLEPDLETKQLWLDAGVAEDHILPGDMKDNFWEMGEVGPCGPCTEVHYDKVGGRNAAHLVNQDDPLVVEIWNNVFIQFDRQKDRSLKSLPAKHVDTGMGFERLVSALQDKTSNYATDIFTPLFAKIQEVTGVRSYTDKYGKDDVDGIDTAYRVVADHIRLLSFAIADGAAPNNIGRGYVVRRVLRRGVRYARKYLQAEIGSFFSKILPALVEQMGEQFPELKKAAADIEEILNEEEVAFAVTLDRGEKQFEKYAALASKNGESKLSGSDVWRLYDTFGFPIDLTKLMAEERGLTIDEAEVKEAQEKAREASKAVNEKVATFAKLNVHQIAELENELKIPRPNSDAKYKKGSVIGTVQLIFDGKSFQKSSKDLPPKTPLGLLLDKTNFYAEAGGQVADTGSILIDDVAEFKVLDVQEFGGYIVHYGFLEYGDLSAGDEVICDYDEVRRAPIRNNHTGTHILNHALMLTLGDEINQKGSLVDNEKLRFDFSHKSQVTLPEIKKIEDISNDEIKRNLRVYAKEVELDKAREIHGLRAVFGETYPNPVRVVSVGVEVDELLQNPKNAEWKNVSVEFCGGTHVDSTGSIKDLIVVEEGGIAKGIRRIVAYTGEGAHQAQREAKAFDEKLDHIAALEFGPQKASEVKAASVELDALTISVLTKEELKKKFAKIQKEVVDEQKKRQKAESGIALKTVQEGLKEDKNFFVGALPISANAKAISDVISHYKSKDKTRSVYVFAGSKDDAVMHGVYVGSDLASKGVTAEAWTAAVTEVLGGKTGGKEPSRQGAGANPEKLDEAVVKAEQWLEEKLKALSL